MAVDKPRPISSSDDHKSQVRKEVWSALREVALPDSRFHYDFSSFIADFEGSFVATEKLITLPCYQSANIVFITPDNCLEGLRLATLEAGKTVLTTSYAIRRGFWLLDPATISPQRYEYASTMDGMEKLARPVKLASIAAEILKVDLMVTGTGAINMGGVRLGKGHGFFDLEWGMLYTLGTITQETRTAAVVHDCQVLSDALTPELFDTVCDIISTPTRVIEVLGAKKPECGILWNQLAEGMYESIPPLRELEELIDLGIAVLPVSNQQTI